MGDLGDLLDENMANFAPLTAEGQRANALIRRELLESDFGECFDRRVRVGEELSDVIDRIPRRIALSYHYSADTAETLCLLELAVMAIWAVWQRSKMRLPEFSAPSERPVRHLAQEPALSC
jgi:hypothetical protein